MTMAQADVLDPDDVRWADALHRVGHDVYHLPEYARLDAGHCGGTPVAYMFRDGDRLLLLPLVLRGVPGTDLRDAASPYGYPGPVSNAGPQDAAFWRRAGRALTGQLRERGVVTAFVRLNPLLPAPAPALSAAGAVVHHGLTVSVDLTLTPEQMWGQTHRTHRNQINKARRAGVSVEFDGWDRLDEWIGVYHDNMRRVGATGFWRRACAALVATLRDEGLVTAFVRLHPLLPAPLPVLGRYGTLVRHGETVSMDLTVSVEEMWRQTRSDHRNHINRARRAGTRVLFDDWDRLDEWVAVYHDNMRRVGAGSYYFFTGAHLAALREAVGDRMHLAIAVEGDEVVGGNTFFEHDGIATGYVSSTRRARHRYADELLYDEVRRWCKQRGDTVFHLGGGKGGSCDSLFSYKAGFSPRRHPFHTWRVVADSGAYRRLVRERRPGADPADRSGMFPSYR